MLISLPLGYTTTKEYAEIEFSGAVWMAVVWVAYAIVFFTTVVRRKTQHIYVGNWFFGAFILVIAMLHVVNHLAIPVDWFKSYPVYSGATDAMVQWWYGHNAVGFFLTTGFLGMMYYFVPKQVGRPVYSYRLSIVHFWALITLYIWAGPHHLHYTALPDWAQSLGMAMSLILLAPSWGGMINGMSLRPVRAAPSIDRISSLVLRTDQPLDIDRLSEFMNELLEDHGKQLLRYKGVLNIAGEDRRMVFQGVLKLYGFDWDTEWEEGEARESVIVFIADELPEDKIREGFQRVYQA